MSRTATERRRTPTPASKKTHAQMHTTHNPLSLSHKSVALMSRLAWPSLQWAARYLHYRIGLGRNSAIASEPSMYS